MIERLYRRIAVSVIVLGLAFAAPASAGDMPMAGKVHVGDAWIPVSPPGGTAEFKPGGLHIMLMGPKRKLAEGDKVIITLGFGNGETRDVAAVVRARKPGGMDHNHSHKHGS